MQVNLQTANINNNSYRPAQQPAFTGAPRIHSKLFDPVKKQYDNLAEGIARNYYEKFYRSKFAKKFIDKTKNVKNMTTHMSAIGATLISGMYTVRTLQNDKLDPEKRKTLALNDVMTWAISTAGSYFLDNKLGDWCNKVTTRFVANYVATKPEAKNIELLGDWDPKKIYKIIEDAPQIAYDKITEMKSKLSPEEFSKWLGKARINEDDLTDISDQLLYKKYLKQKKALSKNPEKLKEWIKNAGTSEEILTKISKSVTKNVLDLNLDFLRDKRLTTLIDGIGVLKSLFVFGMVYRYIVPVLVMKPANKIGAYLHQKNAEKEQAANKAA